MTAQAQRAEDWTQRLRRVLAPRARHDPAEWRLGDISAPDIAQAVAALPAPLRPSAVLLPIIDRRPEPTVLLTVRAADLRHHAGQISFPGGRLEGGDADPLAAAIREAEEEVGLAPSQVELLGYLPDHLVLTGFRITPVVARVHEPVQLRIDDTEVAEVFELPWSFLTDESRYQRRHRALFGLNFHSPELHYGAYHIWGATAAMLHELRSLWAGTP